MVRRKPLVVVVMGVSGVGKTTIGRRLASRLGWSYYDADDFHPAENVAKMSRGVPLTDADREAWLEGIRATVAEHLERKVPAVVACSALKKSYREKLKQGEDRVAFLYLKAPRTAVEARIGGRTGHFFNPALLASQYDTLEEPDDAIVVDATAPVEEVVEEAVKRMG